MRVLVTGSRHWTDHAAIYRALQCLRTRMDEVVVIHGAMTGADTLADAITKELGFTPVGYVAQWHKYGNAAGPIRNQAMVDSGPDVVLAFHEDFNKSKGTKDCVKKARKAGIPVFVWPETEDWYKQWKLKKMKPLFPERVKNNADLVE